MSKEIDKAAVRRALNRQEVRACLIEMAKEACTKLGGEAEIGDGYIIVDTRASTRKPSKKVKVCEPFSPAPEGEPLPKKKRKKATKRAVKS